LVCNCLSIFQLPGDSNFALHPATRYKMRVGRGLAICALLAATAIPCAKAFMTGSNSHVRLLLVANSAPPFAHSSVRPYRVLVDAHVCCC
jgi:hypothetical protein